MEEFSDAGSIPASSSICGKVRRDPACREDTLSNVFIFDTYRTNLNRFVLCFLFFCLELER